jgi:glycosyltransferase involved in cell wall biosynthesis
MLLVTDLERGGTPLRIARLARGLHRAGVEVHAGCLAPPGPVSAELESDRIPTFACGAESPRDLLALWRFWRYVGRVQPDLVHSALTHANLAARLVGWLRRVPVVASTATIEVERPWHRWVERASARIGRAHVVNSRALAEHVVRVLRVPPERVHVIPPSLDPLPEPIERSAARAALGIPDREFVVAWVGRFDPVKRLDLLIRCAEIMVEGRAGASPYHTAVPSRFLLVGDGPERGRVEQLLRVSPAARMIHLLGWREPVAPILSAADAFLLVSLTEGMPNAVLEAMACGLPVVASDIPALRELAGGGQRLLLVGGDQPEGFAAALLHLRDNEAERRRLGHAAAEWARQNLDPQATVEAVLRVYEDVLEGRPSAALAKRSDR